MCSRDRVMAIKVKFTMAAAAILNFAGIEFWRQNGLWGMVFSPCIKFRANICHSGRDIAIKPIFKMAAAAILNLVPSLFLARRRIWIVFLYARVKFRKSNSTGGWVIVLSKIQNGGFTPSWITVWQLWATHEVYMVTEKLCSNFMSINFVVSKILSIEFFANLA